MDARLQRRVQRYGWDKAHRYYEDGWKRQLRPAQELLLEMASLQPGEAVLDAACGTGLVTFPAAQAVGVEGEVVAIDLSDKMVEACRERAQALWLRHVTARQMDAEDLEFDDSLFDAVLCSLGLMYVPDPVESLREMRRVLKPGGRAVVSVWGERKNCGWAEVFAIVDRRVASEVCPLFFQLGGPGAMKTAMKTAGFEDVAVERIHVGLEYKSDKEALTGTFLGGPVALAYGKFDEETRRAADQEYLESIATFRRGDGYEIPGEFVVARGRRVG